MSEAPRVCARPVLPDGSQGDADTYVLASDYDAVTRERDKLQAMAGANALAGLEVGRDLDALRAEVERLRANIDTAERRLSEATIEAIRQGSKMRDEIARLTSAARRAVVALAHASEAMPQYTADYQALSDALVQETTT